MKTSLIILRYIFNDLSFPINICLPNICEVYLQPFFVRDKNIIPYVFWTFLLRLIYQY